MTISSTVGENRTFLKGLVLGAWLLSSILWISIFRFWEGGVVRVGFPLVLRSCPSDGFERFTVAFTVFTVTSFPSLVADDTSVREESRLFLLPEDVDDEVEDEDDDGCFPTNFASVFFLIGYLSS